jgi:hypothetical protein
MRPAFLVFDLVGRSATDIEQILAVPFERARQIFRSNPD